MNFKINWQNLRSSHQTGWLLLDVVMLALLLLNLTWLIFDVIYATDPVREILQQQVPALVTAYAPLHESFFYYDLAFVVIFLIEFGVRWIRAIVVREYPRWYFFPFAHWYDLLGCIPIPALRFLRILRIFSILYRLKKYEIIDFSNSTVYGFFKFYYEVLLEELSDRIVVKVLSGTQEEIRSGSPLFHQIQQQVLLPRKELIVDWLSSKVAQAAQDAYIPKQADLRRYLSVQVDRAIAQNRDVRRLQMIPVLGGSISDTLERAVSDIVAQVIDNLLRDLSSSENHQFIEDIVEVFLQEKSYAQGDNDVAIIDALVELLELVKHQVRIKRWHAGFESPLPPASKASQTEL